MPLRGYKRTRRLHETRRLCRKCHARLPSVDSRYGLAGSMSGRGGRFEPKSAGSFRVSWGLMCEIPTSTDGAVKARFLAVALLAAIYATNDAAGQLADAAAAFRYAHPSN